jgi:hypothetical protein
MDAFTRLRLDLELTHLLSLCKSGTAWQIFAREKADSLALQDRETWESLPMLLSTAVQTSKHGPPRSLRRSTQIQPSTEGANDVYRT